MTQARHIDQSARYIWISLRRAGMPMSVNELVKHWRPVYSPVEMEDALQRLTAAGHANYLPGHARDAWEVTDANLPLPDFQPIRSERPWIRSRASA